MDHAAQILECTHQVYARSGAAADPNAPLRPPVYKVIGICLAIGSGLFIGTSFVLKKFGLLKANDKYNEVAGEGYGYLKNFWWWSGMTLMIVGEGLNFVAYAFTDAILVTPLGALSVVISTILSAIFLKERLSMIGKVACFLCIVGSVVIVMNAPSNGAVPDIEHMRDFVITPGFLSYAGVIVVGAAIGAFWAGPKWGKKNMLVYISICSWVGGLSVVATQGLGAAIIAQASGKPQFNQWFTYVLLVFIIGTLLTEIIFLNKALNLFNAAMVTPTYYVYFTSTTIITSTILFQGFGGTPTSIITVVLGFFTICSGVVLLQLSKSAKDVPDSAVLAGDLDQIQTIAEQEQPETEPKADAIRGAAAIVRRLSSARMRMEMEELKRLHEDKVRETLEPVTEDGAPQYEWDGLRRRRTTLGSQRMRSMTSPAPFSGTPATPHPPLGWSRFPTEEELAEADRPSSPALSSIVGTIRNRARSILVPGHPSGAIEGSQVQSPMHPVQLTEISVPTQKLGDESSPYYAPGQPYGLQGGRSTPGRAGSTASLSSSARRVKFGEDVRHTSNLGDSASTLAPPTPPPHSAKRQFSFSNVFKRHQAHGQGTDGAQESSHRSGNRPISSRGYSNPLVRGTVTEEETLGLVKGDSRNSQSMPMLQRFEDLKEDGSLGLEAYTDEKHSRYGPSITHTPPRQDLDDKASSIIAEEEYDEDDDEVAAYNQKRERFKERSRSGSRSGGGGGGSSEPRPRRGTRGSRSGSSPPPRPPPHGRRGPGPGPPPASSSGAGKSAAFI
ncbi:magnesium transporter NIPA-domain-containing protein [Podospora appendiculata]|uniref:Magnesium transporter NIPA-domain-containing protein n=1 Tax=Podospora appendiculata TaxID=314037 RepID=A0AAE1CBG1_9PEZI|nr:magnesium transporter NIPA-domain-containing protein [Podospora appendiculata]